MMKKEKKRKLSLGDIIHKMNESLGTQENSSRENLHAQGKQTSVDKTPDIAPPTANSELPSQPSFKKDHHTSDSLRHVPPIPSQNTHSKNAAEPLSEAIPPSSSYSQSSFNNQLKQSNLPSMNQPIDKDDEEEFDLFRYLGVILRRKEIIVLTTIAMGLFSLISFLKSTKYYTASARLLFRPHQGVLLDKAITWRYYTDRKRDFNTHLELLKSNIVLERVAKNLGNTIPIGAISGGLNIKQGETGGEETNIIELKFEHTDAEMARDVLNELCKSYIEYKREVNAQEDTRLIFKLKTQIDKIQNNLNTKENALRKFKENHRMVQLSKDANLVMTKLANMEIALQQTQLSLLETKERLTTLKSQIGKQEINIVQSMTYENPMRSKLAQLELELNTLSGEYSRDHFKIKQIIQQIENLKQAMQSEIEKEISEKAVKHTLVKNPIRQALLQTFVNQNIEISALEAKRTAQEQIIEKLNVQMGKLPSLEQEYAFLQRETESLLKTLQMLKMKFEETKIRRDSKESDLKILELAKTPEVAISGKKISSIFIGILIGLIIGIALIFLLEYLDQSLKDPSEVEKQLEIPLIGIVPLIETENAIVNTEKLKKSMLEPFRTLRANIKHIASQHHAKLFMITSAVKGEGKTTLAINLAITFAMDGKKAILIDCDLRRSQIHTLLNIPKASGLSDYITGSKKIDDIIKPTVHDNLFVITSGERPHNPAELLGTPMFNHMLQEVKSRADIIICDSPALIPVSDSMTMAQQMDCCIMVVRALWTPLKAAKQAKNQLLRINANLIGGIFNCISHSQGYYPYYYYYGYYGYYAYKYAYDYDKEPKKKFTIRELGLTFDRKIKAIFQNIRISLPRYLAMCGNFLRHTSKRAFFWILLTLLVSIIVIRYILVPPSQKNESQLISYLGNEQNPDQHKNSPITIVNKDSDINDSPETYTPNTKKTAIKDSINNTYYEQNAEPDSILIKETAFAYQESLSIWMEAFNSLDTSRLMQFYDTTDFKYPGGEFKEWYTQMISNLLKKSNRELIITMDKVSAEKIKNNYYKTILNTTILKGKDSVTVQKTMVWKSGNNIWRIIREKSSTHK